MADFVEPPEELTEGAVNATRRAVEFDSQFKPSLNLMQRRRLRQNEIQDTRNQLELREQEQRRLAQTSAVAQGFYFKTKELEMEKAKFAHNIAEDQKDMEFKERKLVSDLETNAAQRDAARTLEAQRTQRTKFEYELNKERAATEGRVMEALNEKRRAGITPGTREWQDAVAEQMILNPGMPKELRATLKGSAELDEDQLAAKIAEIQTRLPSARVSASSTGATRIDAPGQKAPAQDKEAITAWSNDRNHWQEERKAHLAMIDPSNTPEENAEARRRVKEAQTQLDRLNANDPREKRAPQAADEKVSVVSPDGKTGKVPRSQLDAAIKAGYKPQ